MSFGILPNVNFIKRNRDVSSAQSAHSRTGRLKNNRTKSRKKGDDKSAVAIVNSVRQLSCVSQDTEPPHSATTSREGTKVLGPSRRVRFTKAPLRHANIRENKGPSLGKIHFKIHHQRSPYAINFEDRSPGETARQECCARGDAWELAKKIHKLKKEDKATFYSPSEEWILPAASTIHPEEREFVVDSGASMHMVSKKDLNKAELETVRTSKNPIMVVTANGEVQTKEEATENVREFDLFVTVMLLENTSAVLSLGKLCEEFEYSYHRTSGQKPHLIKNGKKIHCDTSNLVPLVVPALSTSSSFSFTSPVSSSQETVTDTEIPATRRSESASEESLAREELLHRSAEIENSNTNEDEELQSDELQGVPDRLQEFKHGLVDENVNIEILPVLLMNYLWSREQKWYRVNTVFLFTSRKTGIAVRRV